MPEQIKTALDQRAVTKVSSVNEADSVYPRDIRPEAKRQIRSLVPGVKRRVIERVFGIREEAFLHRLHFWLETYRETPQEKIATGEDGVSRQWIINTIESGPRGSWSDDLNWSTRTIHRVIERLKLSEVLIVGEFNLNREIRTKWYSIDYDKLKALAEIGKDDRTFKVRRSWVGQ